MNKIELLEAVSSKAMLDKKSANAAVDATLEVITEVLADGGEITLTGFGKFYVKDQAARTGANPQTGEKLTIPAQTVPKFKPGKILKDAVK